MNVSYVKTLSRFYYSLLISVLMHKRQTLACTPQVRRRHVRCWLKNARRKKLFSKVVLRDIEWLMEQNARLHPDQLEVQLGKIYRSSRLICLTAGILPADYILDSATS